MSLLKGDDTAPKKAEPKLAIVAWPERRLPEGIGMSLKDGWNFGTGFGLAMAIAVPIVLLAIGCILGTLIVIGGGSLGGLL